VAARVFFCALDTSLHAEASSPRMKTRLLLLPVLALTSFAAEAPRVLPVGSLPDDSRLAPLKDLDGYFRWSPPSSETAWKVRAEQLRTQLRVALGIYPEPTRTPLNAVIHGKVMRDGYTVERVYFEAMPGFFLSGSLFRPDKPGKFPGVLCPHGHWADGRFYKNAEANVKRDIQKGGEVSMANGSVPLQARCATLARMGCVVFHYDMLGYADSQQLGYELAHKFGKQSAATPGGLFTAKAESHAQSIMGLQMWASVRALDFMETLPDVDKTRLACTGASGGGTQTFMLAALDPRLAAAFPAVMVGTAMQGGCTCENASLLRVGTGNIEFAALFAPKPMGMTTADDWTKELPTKGFPDLAQHWAGLGAADKVKIFAHPEFPHNYNRVSRIAMYGFFNEHLKLGLTAIDEPEIKPLTREELTVWNAQHPAPAGGADFEKQMLKWWSDDAKKSLTADQIRTAAEAIFQRTAAGEKAAMDHSTFKKDARGEWLLMRGLIENEARKEAVPALFFHPKKWNGHTAIWLTTKGKNGLLNGDEPIDEVARLVASGVSVVGIDLLMQGEFLFDGQSDTPTRTVKNPREAACYTHGYNHSLFAQRVHDVLNTVAFIRDHQEHKSQVISLIALDETAPIAATARLLSSDAVKNTAAKTGDFRFENVAGIRDPYFQPAIAKYGDIPGILDAGKGPLWTGGEKSPIDWLLAQ
jgi:dienelactone hydrolase